MLNHVPMDLIDHPLNTAEAAEDCMELDFIDPLMCSRQDLLALHNRVQDTKIKAFLVGIMDTREYFSLMAPDLRLNF